MRIPNSTRTLVMIHGMWGNDSVWACYKKYFEAKGYTCITPVLRYHDMHVQSEPSLDLGGTSLSDYAEDLEKEIIGISHKPIVIGHSMGALLAQMLGGRGLAKAIILLAPAPPAGLVFFDAAVAKFFLSEISKWGFWRKPVRLAFDKAAYGLFPLLPVEVQKTLHANCVCESGRAIFEILFWYLDSRKATKIDEAKVTCPVLSLVGDEDRVTPSAIVKKVAAKYGSLSAYKEFDHHAHWLLEEPGWEQIASYAGNWLGTAID